MDILVGIFLILTGLAIAFMGIQIFFAILPMLGFLFGFFAGAAAIHHLFDVRFLTTVTGWVVGAIFGIVCALISWYWWYAGVLLSTGVLGVLLGTSLARLLNVNSGLGLFLFGLVGFIGLIALAYTLNLPIYLLIVNTASAGASVLIVGILLVFNQLDRQELGNGTAVALINTSWWWTLVWIAVAVVGIGYQLTVRQETTLPDNRWQPAGTGRAAA